MIIFYILLGLILFGGIKLLIMGILHLFKKL
jgi:hypothetical protein